MIALVATVVKVVGCSVNASASMSTGNGDATAGILLSTVVVVDEVDVVGAGAVLCDGSAIVVGTNDGAAVEVVGTVNPVVSINPVVSVEPRFDEPALDEPDPQADKTLNAPIETPINATFSAVFSLVRCPAAVIGQVSPTRVADTGHTVDIH